MEFNSAAAPPPPHLAASRHMNRCSYPAAGDRRRHSPPTLLAAAGSQVRLRRSPRLAAETSGGPQIPSPPHGKAAKRPSLRPPCCSSRIQSRGAIRRRPSPAAAFPYYWGAKGRRSAPRGGDCSSSSNPPPAPPPRIQSWGEKRKYSLATFPFFFAWGAKRARSAPPDLVQDVDWENLGDGPAGLIAELVLAGGDVADYIRFRAVCRPWRRCSPDPRAGLDGRFLPRRWIMLDKAHAGPRRRRFLNISTGECIRMDLPELDEHILLALTPEGLLLLLHEPTLVARLLNPLTRELTDLPPVTLLLPPGFKPNVESDDDHYGVYGVGVTEDSTVAVCFRYHKVLAIAKPGDKHWTVICKEYFDSTLPFAGRFYCCVRSRVMVLDTSCSNQQPRLLEAVEGGTSFRFSRMTDRLHLVDNAGELMLVHRLLYQDPEGKFRRTHMAYRVDLDARAVVPAKALGRRAVFIGQRRTISVRPQAFPSVADDKFYFGFDCEETCAVYQSDGYKLEDGSGEPPDDLGVVVHPYSFINCLSHCIQGSGHHLA